MMKGVYLGSLQTPRGRVTGAGLRTSDGIMQLMGLELCWSVRPMDIRVMGL